MSTQSQFAHHRETHIRKFLHSLTAISLLLVLACGTEKQTTEAPLSKPEADTFETTSQSLVASNIGIKDLGRYTFKNGVGDNCIYRSNDVDSIKTRPCAEGATAFTVIQMFDGNYNMCLPETFTSYWDYYDDGEAHYAQCMTRNYATPNKTTLTDLLLAVRYSDGAIKMWPGKIVARSPGERGHVLAWRGSSDAVTRRDSDGHVGLYPETGVYNQQWAVTRVGP